MMWWLDACDLIFGLFCGIWLGQRMPKVPVTTKVILPPDPVPEKKAAKYTDIYSGTIAKLKVGGNFGDGVTFNNKGSMALATIIEDLSIKLDRAVDLALIEHARKQQQVQVFNENAWVRKFVRPKKTT